jgi:hypothetical protein
MTAPHVAHTELAMTAPPHAQQLAAACTAACCMQQRSVLRTLPSPPTSSLTGMCSPSSVRLPWPHVYSVACTWGEMTERCRMSATRNMLRRVGGTQGHRGQQGSNGGGAAAAPHVGQPEAWQEQCMMGNRVQKVAQCRVRRQVAFHPAHQQRHAAVHIDMLRTDGLMLRMWQP